ncbi:hypothetical protein WK03_35305 [Burkholderia cepacia]|uniref:hypothetical protein n=1 Tax=Burkholderia cepacia TaxID=292 RepID=UPI000753FAF0|nr:hypothetical protein [Burkholderia cepacia]KVQ35738.1 hypothetical protein WK03_35305 [Burkholderia cepacia]
MPKGRITVTFDYDIHPEHYDGRSTPQEMVAMDAAGYDQQPDMLLEAIASSSYTVTGTVVEE